MCLPLLLPLLLLLLLLLFGSASFVCSFKPYEHELASVFYSLVMHSHSLEFKPFRRYFLFILVPWSFLLLFSFFISRLSFLLSYSFLFFSFRFVSFHFEFRLASVRLKHQMQKSIHFIFSSFVRLLFAVHIYCLYLVVATAIVARIFNLWRKSLTE